MSDTNPVSSSQSHQAISNLSGLAPAGDTVVDAFDRIERWQSAVSINGKDTRYYVGRSPSDNTDAYRLYDSEAPHEFVGTLLKDRDYREGLTRVGFQPATTADQPDSHRPGFHSVSHLEVTSHGLNETLNDHLCSIRSALTGLDWSQDRVDSGYGDWLEASNALATFIDEEVDVDLCITPQAVLQPRIMHGIARYPFGADELLSQAATSFYSNGAKTGHEPEHSPEALRAVLLQFADSLDQPTK